jgi:adenine phosphoribosyltransferase
MALKRFIRAVPDFPQKGVIFRDITPLLANSRAFKKAIDDITRHFKRTRIDVVAGIESRGFIIGAPVAYKLNLPFVPARKKGKLPYKKVSFEYCLEYGTDCVEMHRDAVKKGQMVLIVDDLLATGGTAYAVCKLIEKLGGKVAGLSFLIELDGLGGREKLREYDVFSLVHFP